MKNIILILIIVCTQACIASSSFEPYSSMSVSKPTLKTAIRAYNGDINTLAHAGAEIVGIVYTSGNGYASRSFVENELAEEAARYGGTHYIIADERTDNEDAQVTQDTATTTLSGQYGIHNI